MGAKSIGFISALEYLSCFGNSPLGEVPLLFGAKLRSQTLGLSTLRGGFGKDKVFLLFLGLFDFINN